MLSEQALAALIKTNQDLASAMRDMLLQLHASQTLVKALMNVLAEDTDKLPTLAREIASVAEKEHGIALGHAMADGHLRERSQVLRGMLPPALRARVVLPDA